MTDLLAVFGALDCVVVCAEQLDAELGKDAVLVQGLGKVERRLSAHGGEDRVGPLLGDDVLVDPARGDVVGARRWEAGEALVMAEVEIGLGAVVGDEDLAVLRRAHRARIDVEVGVQFAQANPIAARLQERAEGGRRQPFSQ